MDTISLTEFIKLRIPVIIATIMVFLMVFVPIVIYLLEKKKIENKYKEKIMERSERYNELLELNRKYKFHNLSSYYDSVKWVSSKSQYDRFDFDKYFEKIVELEREAIHKYQLEVIENQRLEERYNEELSRICDYANVDMVKEMKLNWEKYHRLEVELTKGLIQEPVTKAWMNLTEKRREQKVNEGL